jgi:hypothetical protein
MQRLPISAQRIRRSQRDQGYTDDDKDSRPNQRSYPLTGDLELQYLDCHSSPRRSQCQRRRSTDSIAVPPFTSICANFLPRELR